MRFIELTISNFRSFYGQHTFDFADGHPGLHFVTGRNEAEPDLGANGSGKSTLWDAINWCWFGKTLRGIHGPSVRAWGTNEKGGVGLRFEHLGSEHTITRTFKPNRLTHRQDNGPERDIDDNQVEKLLGFNDTMMQHSMIIGQFATLFVDMMPSAKLALFTELLDLEFWVQCAEASSSRAKSLDQKLRAFEAEIAENDGSLRELARSLKEEQENARVFAKKSKQAERELQALVKRGKAERAAVVKAVAKLKTEQKGFQEDVAELDEEYHDTVDRIARLRKEREQALAEMGQVRGVIAELDKVFMRFETVSNTCPYCNQKVGPKHISREKEANRKEHAIQKKKLSRKQVILDEANAEQRKLEAAVAALGKSRSKAREEVAHLDTEIRLANRELDRIDDLIERTEETIQQGRKNPHMEIIERLEQRMKAVERRQQAVVAEKEKIEKEEAAFSFWTKGFKDLRLSLLDEALVYMEAEVNSYLMQLGMPDWKIVFDIERETKSGKISREFQMVVKSPANEEPVAFNTWSGGEAQRLRLACTFGLSSLILGRLGISNAPIILDEPTQHLSVEGTRDLLALLADMAESQKRQIWIVDHRSMDFGEFSSITHVIKTVEGSRVEVQSRS